tara:strand:- start:1487 stop:1654 length:168 start_codon:yes stop_codon:yes gene_type:complete
MIKYEDLIEEMERIVEKQERIEDKAVIEIKQLSIESLANSLKMKMINTLSLNKEN